MMRIPGRIPISISPFFWVTAALIGWINSIGTSNPLLFTLIWVFVVFVSILVHELGHALASVFFGQQPRIELIAFGGATYPEGIKLKGWKEFLVVLDGPLFGFSLFFLATLLLKLSLFTTPLIISTLQIFQWVNLFWTIINLLPIMPLDGGQLLRIVCESVFGTKGISYAMASSMVISALCSLLCFLFGLFIVGAIFFIFTFQNFDLWRRSKILTESDQNEYLSKELKEIEELFLQNKKEGLIPRLKTIREKAKKGLIFNVSTQYLATLEEEKGDNQKVYELLSSIKKYLSPESIRQLHAAAYEVKDYPLVSELSAISFQYFPGPDVAIHSAEASAALKDVEATIGWLQAAIKYGVVDLSPIISKEVFNFIQNDPKFREFVHSLS